MNQKQKEWKISYSRPELPEELLQSGFPPLLAAVLAQRGIRSCKAAEELFFGGEVLYDPMLMTGMAVAVDRIKQAIARGETVAVYGDYDVDGITSTCLLTDYLRSKGLRCLPYIPDRNEEGYGLNNGAVDALRARGASLLITVDCGITALSEVEHAAQIGLEVIITDHHECGHGQLPRAVAVIDCKQDGDPYPNKDLAGVGVALKLAMAVAGRAQAPAVLREYRDLAAVGTVADVMPMTGENRAIVSEGLRDLNPPRRLGLAKLVACAGLGDKPVTSVSVGYTLAPRINASGRMGRAEVAVELLLTRDPERAELLAQELCALNRERQAVESDIFHQCVHRLALAPQTGAIVLADEGWHQGVVGIVASRLTEKYGCPAFMICLDHGMGKGSCRSWGGMNLFELLRECAPLLENFGGHAMAAGFTVREENIPALAQALRQAVARRSQGEDLPSVLEADAVVSPAELTVEAVESLSLLEPCGTGNPRPVLVVRGAQVQSMAQVGRGRHLKLRLESRGASLDAIYLSADGGELGLTPGCRVDAAFYPQINEFRGLRTVQIQIIDLAPAPSRAQMERSIYERFRRGEALTAEEARFLLPSRAEFVGLWRWLERQSAAGTVVEDTLSRIARGASRKGGQREVPARTLLCLEVLEERGLIRLGYRGDRIQIRLCHVEQKADLDASPFLVRLRRAAQE